MTFKEAIENIVDLVYNCSDADRESDFPKYLKESLKVAEESAKVLDESMENTIVFDLSLPLSVYNKEEFYLSLINFLVEELRKYVNVKIYNESILEQWKQKVEEQCKMLNEEIL